MKEQFQFLKDSLTLTKKSLETVANSTGGEISLLVTSCADMLQANITYVNALELQAQTYLAERNRLLTFINNKGLLQELNKK